VIIGERSFGKGSVQNVIEMENRQSALKLTTASYWRPSGKNIHRFPDSKETDEWGVKPSDGFEVKMAPEEFRDYFLWRADRDVIRDGQKPRTEVKTEAKKDNPNPRTPPKDFKDRVMEKALETIRAKLKSASAGLLPEQGNA
jgi:carboxyl-terminal processing protease